MADQVQAFVNQLATLAGVQGAFIFDSHGTIQQYSTPMKVSLDQGVALARTLSRTLTGLSTVHGSPQMDIDLVYTEGRLVLKGMAQGALCVICERHANYSLLNITLAQGLPILRDAAPAKSAEPNPAVVETLKEIAQDVLGEHAPKVITIIESAGSDRQKLEAAIQQAEKMTRMFINKDQASELAERMRGLITGSSQGE